MNKLISEIIMLNHKPAQSTNNRMEHIHSEDSFSFLPPFFSWFTKKEEKNFYFVLYIWQAFLKSTKKNEEDAS